jgi:hypothetical protein
MLLLTGTAIASGPRFCSENPLVEKYGITKEFGDDWYFYQADDNSQFLIVGNLYTDLVFFSPDGIDFYELCQTGSGPNQFENATGKHISFYNPADEAEADMVVFYKPRVEGERLSIGTRIESGDLTYNQVVQTRSVNLIPMPSVQVSLGLFGFEEGSEDYLYLSVDRFHYSYETIQLALITPEGSHVLEIVDIESYRDGGTLLIVTTEGTLYVPSKTIEDEDITWGDQILVSIEPDTCIIDVASDPMTVDCE